MFVNIEFKDVYEKGFQSKNIVLIKVQFYFHFMIQQLNDSFQQRCQLKCNSVAQTSRIELVANTMEANTKT